MPGSVNLRGRLPEVSDLQQGLILPYRGYLEPRRCPGKAPVTGGRCLQALAQGLGTAAAPP